MIEIILDKQDLLVNLHQMKKSFGILMSFLILFISMQQGIILLHFKLNQDYYAKNLCINQDKPELDCQGKCQLEIEIEKSSDDNSIEYLSIYKEVRLLKTEFFSFTIPQPFLVANKKQKIFERPNHYQIDYYFQDFKPPIV